MNSMKKHFKTCTRCFKPFKTEHRYAKVCPGCYSDKFVRKNNGENKKVFE